MSEQVNFQLFSADLIRDVSYLREMDPYCEITIGNKKLSSTVCKNGGKRPIWDETISFRINSDDKKALVQLKQKNWLLSDNVLGTCYIDLNYIRQHGGLMKRHNLTFNDKFCGKVLFNIQYQKENISTDQQVIINNMPIPWDIAHISHTSTNPNYTTTPTYVQTHAQNKPQTSYGLDTISYAPPFFVKTSDEDIKNF